MAKGKQRQKVILEKKKRKQSRMSEKGGSGKSRYSMKKRGQVAPKKKASTRVFCNNCYMRHGHCICTS